MRRLKNVADPGSSTHLTLIDAGGCRRIVSVFAPRWLVKVNYKVAIIRDDRIIESQFADRAPTPERAPLKTHCSLSRALIGHFNLEGESAFRQRIAFIKNLRHDFVAKI